MGTWKWVVAALAVGLGLAWQLSIASAEGDQPPPPPRVVLVQTAGVGAERQTTVMSSNNPTTRVVPSEGTLSGGSRPEAVLGERVARPAPAGGPPDDLIGAMIAAVADGALGPRASSREAVDAVGAIAASLPPEQLSCVQDALGRAVQSGLISRERPSIGTSQMLWVAGQCNLDAARLAPLVARALSESRPSGPDGARPRPDAAPPRSDGIASRPETATSRAGAVASRPDGAPSRPDAGPSRPDAAPSRPDIGAPRPESATSQPDGAPSRPYGASEPAGRPSWQRSVLDDPDASVSERLARMRAASAPPPEPHGLPAWQLVLLGLTGLAGLGGAVYGMSWLARPRYIVRVIPPSAPAPRRVRGSHFPGGRGQAPALRVPAASRQP